MPVFIGNRDDVVRTLAGHVIAFKEGEEVFVPEDPYVVRECLDRGHRLKDKDSSTSGTSGVSGTTKKGTGTGS